LTCFEQYHAHLQEVKLYCYSIWYRHSAIQSTGWERTQRSPLSTGALNSCLQRVTIPDAVTVQSDLLKMNMLLLKTCRGL